MRTALPLPFLSYYPALYPQSSLTESVTLLGSTPRTLPAGHPPHYEDLGTRDNYNTTSSAPLSSFGATKEARLGDVVLARSGDKGSNLNVGFFVRTAQAWDWLRSFLSHERFVDLVGEEDWDADKFFLERVEFPKIFAVHFVVYGILGRGVSGSSRLDCLGKGFADFVRDRIVDVPEAFLG